MSHIYYDEVIQIKIELARKSHLVFTSNLKTQNVFIQLISNTIQF